jgi:hypothetical protein
MNNKSLTSVDENIIKRFSEHCNFFAYLIAHMLECILLVYINTTHKFTNLGGLYTYDIHIL